MKRKKINFQPILWVFVVIGVVLFLMGFKDIVSVMIPLVVGLSVTLFCVYNSASPGRMMWFFTALCVLISITGLNATTPVLVALILIALFMFWFVGMAIKSKSSRLTLFSWLTVLFFSVTLIFCGRVTVLANIFSVAMIVCFVCAFFFFIGKMNQTIDEGKMNKAGTVGNHKA